MEDYFIFSHDKIGFNSNLNVAFITFYGCFVRMVSVLDTKIATNILHLMQSLSFSEL